MISVFVSWRCVALLALPFKQENEPIDLSGTESTSVYMVTVRRMGLAAYPKSAVNSGSKLQISSTWTPLHPILEINSVNTPTYHELEALFIIMSLYKSHQDRFQSNTNLLHQSFYTVVYCKENEERIYITSNLHDVIHCICNPFFWDSALVPSFFFLVSFGTILSLQTCFTHKTLIESK